MPSLNFRIVNVFTQQDGALTGNPLCVFEDAASLDSKTMQALARQFNLSETTFILPSTKADAQVRIFTPSYEMPFAGHPTLGTAFVCHALGKTAGANRDKVELRLEMPAGIIPVRAEGRRWTLQANVPTWRECDVPRTTLAQMLSLELGDIGERPLWVKSGKEQLIVPLNSERAVRAARARPDLFSQVRSEEGYGMAYVFAPPVSGLPRDSLRAALPFGREPSDRTLARFFFPDGAAMLEDPATGSATANFGGWLLATGRQLPCSLVISQGEYVARPSTLYLDVDTQGRIFVGGDVIELARGTLQL